MSKQRESNGPARQDRAIKEVRSNPAGYFEKRPSPATAPASAKPAESR